MQRKLSPPLAAAATLPTRQVIQQWKDAAKSVSARIPEWDGRLVALLKGRGYHRLVIQAFRRITVGAALGALAQGHESADFLEQVQYYGRRLAKLNVPPSEIHRLLREHEAECGDVQFDKPGDLTELRLAIALAINDAYYQVRESEAETFFALSRVELANNIDDLTTGFTQAIQAAFPAETCTIEWNRGQKNERPASRSIEGGSRWRIPIHVDGVLGGRLLLEFSRPYRWLPREKCLLEAACERFGGAIQKLRLMEDLAQREREVRRLANHVLQVEEQERRRVSRELHDETGQSLLLLRLELERLEADLADPIQRARVVHLREVAEHVISEVRRLICSLSPAVLEQMGLLAAIRQLAARISDVQGLRVRLDLPELEADIPQQSRIVLYRVLQECISNVVKHSGGSTLKISLGTVDSWIQLEVADNGKGFEAAAAMRKAGSFGLNGMMERLTFVGGQLWIHSAAGRGSRIRARVPA